MGIRNKQYLISNDQHPITKNTKDSLKTVSDKP